MIWRILHSRCWGFNSKGKLGGFTLIEMIVAFTIFIIVTSVVLFKGRVSQRQVQVRGVAYDIAYLVQKIQILGGSALETAGKTNSQIYGLAFLYPGSGANPNSIAVYKDSNSITPGNASTDFFQTGGGDLVVDSFSIPSSAVLKLTFCTCFSYGNTSTASLPSCTATYSGAGAGNYSSIEFHRRSQDITDLYMDNSLRGALSAAAGTCALFPSPLAIQVSSADDTIKRYVVIGRNGSVSVL